MARQMETRYNVKRMKIKINGESGDVWRGGGGRDMEQKVT